MAQRAQNAEIISGPLLPAQRISLPHGVLHLSIAGRFRDGVQVICGQEMETAMTPQNVHKLHVLSRHLTESLMRAALCAKEIGEIAQAQSADGHVCTPDANGNGHGRNGSRSRPRPLLDESTLSVIWKERSLHLGHTRSFRLLARLARSPGQYVTHLDLLEEVWDDEDKATATIRSVVRHLRRQLCNGGMKELASGIRGHNGRYILDV